MVKNTQAELPPETNISEDMKRSEVIYVSKSPSLCLANFRPDRMVDGQNVPGEDINFRGHCYQTADKNKQKFIEASQTYERGAIVKFRDYKEAAVTVAAFNADFRGRRRTDATVEEEYRG